MFSLLFIWVSKHLDTDEVGLINVRVLCNRSFSSANFLLHRRLGGRERQEPRRETPETNKQYIYYTEG